MSRRLTLALVAAFGSVAHAQEAPGPATPASAPTTETAPAPAPTTAPAPPTESPPTESPPTNANAPADMGDQAISAMIGVAGGGRSTPGGLLVAGHFYYQLSDQDWFDGSASFVFGSGDAECFRDRANETVCDHGLADGYGAKVGIAARRFLPTLASNEFWPFVRAGVGISIVRFPDDEITGVTFTAIGGAGLRVSLTEAIALTAEADLDVGIGAFSNGLGAEPQLGVSVSVGAEFKL